jgi:hypothetical protein
MRISVSNWQTDADDVKRTIQGVERGLQSLKTAAMVAR